MAKNFGLTYDQAYAAQKRSLKTLTLLEKSLKNFNPRISNVMTCDISFPRIKINALRNKKRLENRGAQMNLGTYKII